MIWRSWSLSSRSRWAATLFDGNASVGGGMLGQEFTKLAEFDQGRIRVIKDITFSESGMADEYLIVLHEEREIR
jgi:hypothetical protein